MIRAVIVLGLSLVAAVGCAKKEDPNSFDSVFRMTRQYRDYMCTCRSETCATNVSKQMAEWTATLSKDAASYKPTSTQNKELSVVSEDLAKCFNKAMMASAPPVETPPLDAPIDAPAIDAPAPRSELPEPVPPPVTTEALLASVRAWARGEHDQLRIAELDVRYVGADGVLDPEHGFVSIELGRAPPAADDPKRRTGVPIKLAPEQPTKCADFEWRPAKGWRRGYRTLCMEAALPFPRCSIETIWKRAIALGAPADAVAMLQLREGKTRRWAFTITDEPRGVKISHRIADDCDMVVEQP